MGKKIVLISFCLVCFSLLLAADFQVGAKANNYYFDPSGSLDPNTYQYGIFMHLSDQVVDNLNAKIYFDSTLLQEYILSGRVSYNTRFLEVSAGPTFGIMNKTKNKTNFSYLIQPGIGIGFTVTSPGVFFAQADTDFGLPTATSNYGQVFIQNGQILLGFYLPNMLCSFGIKQKANSIYGNSNQITGITDYGFYTEAFKKGASFRIGFDFIYRISDCFLPETPSASIKNAHLILGSKITWIPYNNFNFFVAGSGSLFSYSLKSSQSYTDIFLFEIQCGTEFKIETRPGLKSY